MYIFTYQTLSWRWETSDCKRDRLWVSFPFEEINYLMFISLL